MGWMLCASESLETIQSDAPLTTQDCACAPADNIAAPATATAAAALAMKATNESSIARTAGRLAGESRRRWEISGASCDAAEGKCGVLQRAKIKLTPSRTRYRDWRATTTSARSRSPSAM